MNKILLTIFFLLVSNILFGQISGTVKDNTGISLPYVNIFIENTTIGTVSNVDGEFGLDVGVGETIIFRYIGFEDKKIQIESQNQILDIVLNEQAISIDEIVIIADAEDPAYDIIRKAISKRDYHRNQVDKYTVNTYGKGVVKMLEAPEKILGQEVGDMEGMLDTTGQGIVYLSESQSEVSFMEPDNLKEVMISSKVSGSDGSFNINRFTNTQYEIYDEYFNFIRTVINPLADNSFTFYKFKLEGAIYGDEGRLVNKIKVIPKSANRPVVSGYIYIAEDFWNVVQLDFVITGKSMKQPIMDSIILKQQFLPVEGDIWRLFSQEMRFTAGAFGFKVGGAFSYIFSEYNINPDIDESFFNSEVFKMEKSALETDSTFWTEIRPIPLTDEERLDYIKKDSLSQLWNSKEWKDSVDREENKFKFINLLFGYNYSDSYNDRYLSFSSPLNLYRFNIVEGHSVGLGINYTSYDTTDVHQFNVKSNIGYGSADQRIKINADATYRLNRIHQEFISFGGGDTYKQYFNGNPAIVFLNTWDNLLYKRNIIRLYRSQYGKIGYQRELINGLYFWTNLQYERRLSLAKNSDYSFFNRTRTYERNNPIKSFEVDDFFDPYTATTAQISLRWRPLQKYASYPKYRLREPSHLPDFYFHYRKAIAGLGDADYDRIWAVIQDNRVSMKAYGYSKFRISGGLFLNKKNTNFVDYNHFYTNEDIVVDLLYP